MNRLIYISFSFLFLLASCSEQTEPESLVDGELVEVTRNIQVSILPMQTVGGATRADAYTPQESEAIHVSYGGNTSTRVQEGDTDHTAAESVINNAYILQFDGVVPTSVLKTKITLTAEQLRSGNPITCSFVMTPGGIKNRVYVVANCNKTLSVGSTTLSSFESPVILEPTTRVPSSGLPMSACQDVGVGDSFQPFQLKSLLAKLTFTTNVGSFQFNIPRGYSFYTQSVAGDHAVRPTGMGYGLSTVWFDSGTTCYIPENLSGRNDLLINSIIRCAYFAPENASYVEISGGEKKCTVYLGDGTPQDFNVEGNHWYHVDVNVLGYNEMDLRVGNPTITDLNADGQTANCYIAPSANAWYMFNSTVMGNGATTPLPPDMSSGSVAAPIVPKPLHPRSADVLWETLNTTIAPTKGDVVKSKIYYLKDGRALFRTGSKEGNAVIAARDAQNNIIWSWHIWRTSTTPIAQPLAAISGFAAVGELQIMDRNLGALSAAAQNNLSTGLFYQWGRKDPMPGAAGLSDSNTVVMTTQPSGIPAIAVGNNSKTPIEAVKNPATFYTSSSTPYDWASRNDNLWGTPLTVIFGKYTTNKGSKTIYDPCPVGWRVPPSYTFMNASKSNGGTFGLGYSFGIGFLSSGSNWFSASGYQSFSSGVVYNVGSRGNYWMSAPDVAVGYSAYSSGLYFTSNTVYSDFFYRSYGFGCRCVSETDGSSPPSHTVSGGVNDLWGNSTTNPNLGNSNASDNE